MWYNEAASLPNYQREKVWKETPINITKYNNSDEEDFLKTVLRKRF